MALQSAGVLAESGIDPYKEARCDMATSKKRMMKQRPPYVGVVIQGFLHALLQQGDLCQAKSAPGLLGP